MKLYKQITRKQAGVIFRAYKEGQIEATESEIKKVYVIADYDGYDDNGTAQRMNDILRDVIDSIFAKNFEKANKDFALAVK